MKDIRKVVIPVAGWGTRSLPATKNIPKEMLPIYNKPVIQYVVEEAQRANIEDVIFVTNRDKTVIEDHFDYNLQLEGVLERAGKLDKLAEVRKVAEMVNIMEEILAAFSRQEAPILVGTQMLSKGHHFPLVTLAVIADADLGLNLPDYRAAERTFQLLVQSAGRAGRGDKPGRVLIQTRDVEHYCWQYVRTADYEGFYQAELAKRRLRRYPPFVRLALIRISYALNEQGGPPALNELAQALRVKAAELGVQLLGPAPAPLALLRGRKRFTCLDIFLTFFNINYF